MSFEKQVIEHFEKVLPLNPNTTNLTKKFDPNSNPNSNPNPNPNPKFPNPNPFSWKALESFQIVTEALRPPIDAAELDTTEEHLKIAKAAMSAIPQNFVDEDCDDLAQVALNKNSKMKEKKYEETVRDIRGKLKHFELILAEERKKIKATTKATTKAVPTQRLENEKKDVKEVVASKAKVVAEQETQRAVTPEKKKAPEKEGKKEQKVPTKAEKKQEKKEKKKEEKRKKKEQGRDLL